MAVVNKYFYSVAFTNRGAVKNTVQFKTRRKYLPVGSDAASMLHTVLNQTVFYICAPLVCSQSINADNAQLLSSHCMIANRKHYDITAAYRAGAR
jgi:hypothetical protein